MTVETAWPVLEMRLRPMVLDRARGQHSADGRSMGLLNASEGLEASVSAVDSPPGVGVVKM